MDVSIMMIYDVASQINFQSNHFTSFLIWDTVGTYVGLRSNHFLCLGS